jgi:hypothetical protein
MNSGQQTVTQTQVGPGPLDWTLTNDQTAVVRQHSLMTASAFQGPESPASICACASQADVSSMLPPGAGVGWTPSAGVGWTPSAGSALAGGSVSPNTTWIASGSTPSAWFVATHPANGPPLVGGAALLRLLPFGDAPTLPSAGAPGVLAAASATATAGAIATAGGAAPPATGLAASATRAPGAPLGSAGAGFGGFQFGSGGSAPLLLLLLLGLLVGLFKLAAPRGARLLTLASLVPARVAVAPLERPG